MRSFGSFALLAAVALAVPGAAFAQRQPATPEQRIERLERQVGEMQRHVFPKGRPADSAGFSDDPAATQSSVASLAQRLDAVERQMADMVRQSEENAHQLQQMASDLTQLRTAQEQRISALEQRVAATATVVPAGPPAATPVTEPKPAASKPPKATGKGGPVVPPVAPGGSGATVTPASDPGEDAYTEGFHLWEAGNWDGAITSLRSFTAAYPKHRRTSYANNLIGRSLMSKGDARGAAAAFLANYRNNPGGERAQDSLLGLGQALMQLGQPGQACKAYQELDAVYGAKVRPEVKKQEADAKAQAQCA